MFLYLLLAAAVVAATEETEIVEPELQEIITLLTSEETTVVAEATEVLKTKTEDGDVTVVADNAKPSSIVITNAIEPSMLAYKHWTGTYNPDKFTIAVNGVEVAQGAQHTLPASKDPVEIRFDYSFVNGKRTGAHTIAYELNENITQANITFSWNDEWKVIVDNGKPVKHTEVKA
jgi:hypothetical protein